MPEIHTRTTIRLMEDGNWGIKIESDEGSVRIACIERSPGESFKEVNNVSIPTHWWERVKAAIEQVLPECDV